MEGKWELGTHITITMLVMCRLNGRGARRPHRAHSSRGRWSWMGPRRNSDVFEAPSGRRVNWVRSGRQGRKGAKLRWVALCGNLFLRLKDVGNEDTSWINEREECHKASSADAWLTRWQSTAAVTSSPVKSLTQSRSRSVLFSWQPNWIPLWSFVEIVLRSSSFYAPCCWIVLNK